MRQIRLVSVITVGIAILSFSCDSKIRRRIFGQDGGVGQRRNFILFVTDGLRPGSVTVDTAPTIAALRAKGVTFSNSHSLFPTFTTANASALATGHYLGDTGDFSNTVYVGYPVFSSGSFPKKAVGTVTPFLENNPIIADVDEHFSGNYLTEESLLAYARSAGYSTAAVGKVGPTLLQDPTQSSGLAKGQAPSATIIIDDATGTGDGVPLTDLLKQRLAGVGLPIVAPNRSNGAAGTSGDNGFSGDSTTAGTKAANLTQQQFFADAVSKVILPLFKESSAPFGLVFWSRDPDGTQHNQGDSLGSLTPGINGPTSQAAVHNADANLGQILAFINAYPELAANTDIFVTADHGFSTISRHDLETAGKVLSSSYAQTQTYYDLTGRQEVTSGYLPPGFLAIDIAHFLNLPLFDADDQTSGADGVKVYKPVNATTKPTDGTSQHPRSGDGLIGGTGKIGGGSDAQVIVAANGGSDLIYLPAHDTALATKIVAFLAGQDYVSGLFTDDVFGDIPGALPLSAINLTGTAQLPRPSIVVNFRSFATDAQNPYQSQVIVADTGLQQGQGMHGSAGRGDTFNNMVAYGPDFKQAYVDPSPVGNADVAVTLARVLGFAMPAKGTLNGRVIEEALVGGPSEAEGVQRSTIKSKAEPVSGMVTVLDRQSVGRTMYFDAAGFPGRTNGLSQ